MLRKVLETIERHHMFEPGAAIVVALSGGADSMALLSVLSGMQKDWALRISAAHINHSLRGEESDADEAFVSKYCKQHDIPFYSTKIDVAQQAKLNGEGIEECGRRIRYDFFESVLSDGITATAHTQTDNVETILFNLARGTGLKGLVGIPPVRGRIVRPLIRCTREETERYCSENDLPFVTDSTNATDCYSRNYIRHHVVPSLQKINTAFEKAVIRCADSLREDEELLSSMAEELQQAATTSQGYDIDCLLRAHPSIRKRVIARAVFSETGTAPSNKQINAINNILSDAGVVQVSRGISVMAQKGVLCFPGQRSLPQQWEVAITVGTNATPFGYVDVELSECAEPENTQNVHNKLLDYSIDYGKIKGSLVARCRLPGDKIRFVGRHHTTNVKKLFSEVAIPVDQRSSIVILSDDDGPVWIEGFGCAARCAADSSSTRRLTIDIRRNNNA